MSRHIRKSEHPNKVLDTLESSPSATAEPRASSASRQGRTFAVSTGGRSVARYIRQNPWLATTTASALGILIGVYLRRP